MTDAKIDVQAPQAPWRGLLLWGALALGAASTGLLVRLPRPLVPLMIASGVLGGVTWYRRSPGLRAWVAAADLRVFAAYQMVRIVYGALFLVVGARGELPAVFVERAGYGDLASGLLAAAVIVALTAGVRPIRPLLWGWTAVGLLDMLVVVATAQRLLLIDGDELMLSAFARPQYGVLPLFVVPLIFLTHGAVMTRLRGGEARGEATRGSIVV
jgi:hypothetical protein